jgi:hypothetical protein
MLEDIPWGMLGSTSGYLDGRLEACEKTYSKNLHRISRDDASMPAQSTTYVRVKLKIIVNFLHDAKGFTQTFQRRSPWKLCL